MNLVQARALAIDSVKSWVADFAPSMGAALSYYTMFSIAPLLVIAIAVVGIVFGAEEARAQVLEQMQGLLGPQGAKGVEALLKSVASPTKSGAAAIFGTATLLLGASTVFGELQSALDRIWRAPAVVRKGGVFRLVRNRLLSFGMILGIGFLLLVSLLASAGLSALGEWWAPLFGHWEVLLQVINFLVSFAITTLLFALIYKILPRVQIEWYDVWIGAAVTALLFSIGKFLIGIYLGKLGATSAFGAAGSLLALLVWVYYSAQIFLLGAEFTFLYAHRHGSHRDDTQPTVRASVPIKSAKPRRRKRKKRAEG